MKRLIIKIGLLVLISCGGILGCGRDTKNDADIDVTVEETGSFITQEFEFYSDDEHLIYYNFPESYEVDGKKYALSAEKPSLETLGTRDTLQTIVEMNVEDLTEIPDSYPFETKSGKTYDLKNEQVYVKMQGLVDIPVVEEVYFEDQIGKPDVPSKKMIKYYDKEAGEDKEIEGLLTSYIESKAGHWADILEIEGTFMAPSESCHVYELGGAPNVKVARNAAAPTWPGYETQVLSSLGLDSNFFRVNNAAWSGGQYTQDGWICRNALFTGDMFVATYKATYEATRKANGYATNVYYRMDAEGLDVDSEDITTVYHIKAIVKYKLMQ